MMRLLYILILFKLISLGQYEFLYQNYKPIEDIKLEKFYKEVLKEAISIYGAPAYPVKNVFFFQSKLVEKPYLLSVADVFNWQQLLKKINLESTNTKVVNYLLSECPYIKNSENLSFRQQIKLIRTLNNLIEDKKFFNKNDLKSFDLNSEQRKWAGKGFWGLFFKNKKLLNRSLISTLFKNSVFKYYKTPHHGEGAQNCQSVSLEEGRYIIFLRNRPKDGGIFYTELVHEIFHLLNARLFDWYAEGFATTFSKNLSKKYDFSWESWEKKFKEEKNNPYSLSYKLCTELDELKSPQVNQIVQFTRLWDKTHNRYCVNQTKWLETLPEELRKRVNIIIKKYRGKIKKNQGVINYFN